MPLRTFTIEIRADYSEEGKHEVLLTACRDAARTILTTAMMMQERRAPQVALMSSDFFAGNDDLKIEEDAND